jgi:hypothetical protein
MKTKVIMVDLNEKLESTTTNVPPTQHVSKVGYDLH